VIFATHDRDMIQRVGGRILTLDRGQLASDRELAGSDPPRLDVPGEGAVDGTDAAGSAGKDYRDYKDSKDEEGGEGLSAEEPPSQETPA
jgi:hypothetical protein